MNGEPNKPESSTPETQPANGAEAILEEATGEQHRQFARAFELIRRGIAEKVFPGAALAVAHRGRLLAWEGFGRFTYDASSPEVGRETLWDLASLTKPIATTSMAMLCVERGLLALEAPVLEYLPEFAEVEHSDHHAVVTGAVMETQRAWRRRVMVSMLMAHSSGLPAHRKLYLLSDPISADGSLTWGTPARRQAIVAAARRLPLETLPGTRAEYSDMGFIILGELLERVAGERLDNFCRREVFAQLNLNMSFNPHPSMPPEIPPTRCIRMRGRNKVRAYQGFLYDITHRRRNVQGEVNDENASAMGGVAGHAGLFGDALSVARFGECLLRGGAPLFRPETVALFTTRQSIPAGTSRTLGWDTPSPPSQSGTLFSPRSFGHLGYTGTSLWCDPERQLSVTLLSNRTWPDSRNQAIKVLRPKVHDAIVGALAQ